MNRRPRRASDNDRLSDSALLFQAIEFAAAADAYAKATKGREWTVLHFLIGRSMELALKAYALHVGATERQLRNELGHNITAGLAFAEQNGLTVANGLSSTDRQCIGRLGHWYEQKLLEYPLVQAYSFPRTRIIREILDRLIGAVFVDILGEPQYGFRREKRRKLGMSIDPDARYGD